MRRPQHTAHNRGVNPAARAARCEQSNGPGSSTYAGTGATYGVGERREERSLLGFSTAAVSRSISSDSGYLLLVARHGGLPLVGAAAQQA